MEVLPEDDPNVRRVRAGVQNYGIGLHVLRRPGDDSGVRYMAEVLLPDEIDGSYFRKHLDRYRKQEAREGRPVIARPANEWWVWRGDIPESVIANVRRGNRDARVRLRRKTTKAEFAKAMQQHDDARDQKIIDGYANEFADRQYETGRALHIPQVHVPIQVR